MVPKFKQYQKVYVSSGLIKIIKQISNLIYIILNIRAAEIYLCC